MGRLRWKETLSGIDGIEVLTSPDGKRISYRFIRPKEERKVTTATNINRGEICVGKTEAGGLIVEIKVNSPGGERGEVARGPMVKGGQQATIERIVTDVERVEFEELPGPDNSLFIFADTTWLMGDKPEKPSSLVIKANKAEVGFALLKSKGSPEK